MTVTCDIREPLTEARSEFRNSVPLIQLDCKGLDPVEFVFGNGWKAKSVSFFLHHGFPFGPLL